MTSHERADLWYALQGKAWNLYNQLLDTTWWHVWRAGLTPNAVALLLFDLIRAYEDERMAANSYERLTELIREAYTIRAGKFSLYGEPTDEPIAGWRQHRFIGYEHMAWTAHEPPPPTRCLICNDLRAQHWHVTSEAA